MWPSPRPHESFMRQSLSTLLLLLLHGCLVGAAGSPFHDPSSSSSSSSIESRRCYLESYQSAESVNLNRIPIDFERVSQLSSKILFILPLILSPRLFSWTRDPWLVIIGEEEEFWKIWWLTCVCRVKSFWLGNARWCTEFSSSGVSLKWLGNGNLFYLRARSRFSSSR